MICAAGKSVCFDAAAGNTPQLGFNNENQLDTDLFWYFYGLTRNRKEQGLNSDWETQIETLNLTTRIGTFCDAVSVLRLEIEQLEIDELEEP